MVIFDRSRRVSGVFKYPALPPMPTTTLPEDEESLLRFPGTLDFKKKNALSNGDF